MVDCTKQQREVANGLHQIRCIHSEADTYKQIVSSDVCNACPVVQLRAKSKGCQLQQKYPKVEKKEGIKLGQLPIIEVAGNVYPECPFRYGSGQKMCSITGLPVTPEICNRCDEETREHSATYGESIVNYFGAVRRWVASGRPTRSEKEIEQLFNDNCKGCDRYDPVKHACKSCGCNVSTESSPLSNKLAMATEHCPIGRF